MANRPFESKCSSSARPELSGEARRLIRPASTNVRRTRALVALAALVPALSGCNSGSGGQPTRFLSIGTGGTGGIYYPLGGAIAGMLSSTDTHLTVTAEVSGGAVENLNRIAAGEIDIGFTIGTTLLQTTRDAARYGNVRVLAPLYPSVLHVLVGRSFAATSVSDFAGRRVSVGAAGSGTEQAARDLLEAHGLDYDDIDERFLSFSESASALRDGAIDAAIFVVGYPAAAVLEATTAAGVKLLGLEPERLLELSDRHPHYGHGALPAGAYPGVENDLAAATVMNWLVGRSDLDDATVEALLNALLDRRDELIRVNPIASQIDLDALRRAPLPLHTASERWLGARTP